MPNVSTPFKTVVAGQVFPWFTFTDAHKTPSHMPFLTNTPPLTKSLSLNPFFHCWGPTFYHWPASLLRKHCDPKYSRNRRNSILVLVDVFWLHSLLIHYSIPKKGTFLYHVFSITLVVVISHKGSSPEDIWPEQMCYWPAQASCSNLPSRSKGMVHHQNHSFASWLLEALSSLKPKEFRSPCLWIQWFVLPTRPANHSMLPAPISLCPAVESSIWMNCDTQLSVIPFFKAVYLRSNRGGSSSPGCYCSSSVNVFGPISFLWMFLQHKWSCFLVVYCFSALPQRFMDSQKSKTQMLSGYTHLAYLYHLPTCYLENLSQLTSWTCDK